jgi:hypothetical protein
MVEQLDPPVAQNAAGEPTPAERSETGEPWTPPSGTSNEARFKDWMAQLQAMIDGVTTAAAPHVREIAAKAAELAAKAGEAAGPFAKRAAEATSDVGQKVASKSRDFAADMRRMAEGEAAATGNGHVPVAEASAEPATAPAAEPIAETPFTDQSTEA